MSATVSQGAMEKARLVFTPKRAEPAAGPQFDIEACLADHEIPYTKQGDKFFLHNGCVYDSSHTGRDAPLSETLTTNFFITVFTTGARGARQLKKPSRCFVGPMTSQNTGTR